MPQAAFGGVRAMVQMCFSLVRLSYIPMFQYL